MGDITGRAFGTTTRKRTREEPLTQKFSRQRLLAMGFDPTEQHLTNLKQLFRRKFNLDS